MCIRDRPKAALVFGPWRRTEFFVNAGRGFHSNDARGTTDPAQPVPGLVQSRGGELGVRSVWVPGLQSSLALWQLDLDSELVYIGDAGTTEPTRASRRTGLEWNNHWQLDGWLGRAAAGWLVDLDAAVSKARYRSDPDGEGTRVPGSVDRVVSAGLTWADPASPWSAQFQVRHFGPRDLTSDGSQRSRATTLASLRGGWRLDRRTTLTLDVFNLFDRDASDIDYFYESAPPNAAAGERRHFHPVEPRTLRLTLAVQLRCRQGAGQSTVRTSGWVVSVRYSSSSCSRLVAVTVMVTPRYLLPELGRSSTVDASKVGSNRSAIWVMAWT